MLDTTPSPVLGVGIDAGHNSVPCPIGFGIIGAAQLPVLGRQLVVGIISLPGSDHIAGSVLNRTGHEPAQRIVAVLVGQAGLAVLYRIELPVNGMAMGQGAAF